MRWTAVWTALAITVAACGAEKQPASESGGSDAKVACAQGYKVGQPGIGGIFCHGTARAHVMAGATTKDMSFGSCIDAPSEFAIAFGVAINVKFTGPTSPDYFTVILTGNKKKFKNFIAAIDGSTRLVDTEQSVKFSNGGKTVALSGIDQYGMPVTAVVNC